MPLYLHREWLRRPPRPRNHHKFIFSSDISQKLKNYKKDNNDHVDSSRVSQMASSPETHRKHTATLSRGSSKVKSSSFGSITHYPPSSTIIHSSIIIIHTKLFPLYTLIRNCPNIVRSGIDHQHLCPPLMISDHQNHQRCRWPQRCAQCQD